MTLDEARQALLDAAIRYATVGGDDNKEAFFEAAAQYRQCFDKPSPPMPDLHERVARLARSFGVSFILGRSTGWCWTRGEQRSGFFPTLPDAIIDAEANCA